MTKKISILTAAAMLCFAACQNNPKNDTTEDQSKATADSSKKSNDIPFTLAKNYFVLNTVDKLDNPKIETAETFNATFGMATTMGPEGKPTDIDFKTQFVIGVILPETDHMTTIEPVSLQKDAAGNMTFSYKKVVTEKMSSTIRPGIQVIVSNSEKGSVALKEIK